MCIATADTTAAHVRIAIVYTRDAARMKASIALLLPGRSVVLYTWQPGSSTHKGTEISTRYYCTVLLTNSYNSGGCSAFKPDKAWRALVLGLTVGPKPKRDFSQSSAGSDRGGGGEGGGGA